MDIKPIQTYYNGYKFRSRLEARWAVFFDAAGIRYEYEPEGFEMPDGKRYLPDFYLPDEDVYVEVKPEREGSDEELIKALGIVENYHKVLLVLRNVPYDKNCNVWWFPCYYYHPVSQDPDGCRVTFLPKWSSGEDDPIGLYLCRYFYVGINSRVSPRMFRDAIAINDNDFTYPDNYSTYEAFNHPIVDSCYLKARQARFEYGETPCV